MNVCYYGDNICCVQIEILHVAGASCAFHKLVLSSSFDHYQHLSYTRYCHHWCISVSSWHLSRIDTMSAKISPYMTQTLCWGSFLMMRLVGFCALNLSPMVQLLMLKYYCDVLRRLRENILDVLNCGETEGELWNLTVALLMAPDKNKFPTHNKQSLPKIKWKHKSHLFT